MKSDFGNRSAEGPVERICKKKGFLSHFLFVGPNNRMESVYIIYNITRFLFLYKGAALVLEL